MIPKAKLLNLRIVELSGVDRPCHAPALAALMKRAPAPLDVNKGKLIKSSLYTDEVDGHQHKVCVYEDGSMYVESATAAGASQWHSHGIVFEGGVLTILADSGHTHALAEGQPALVVVAPTDVVVVQASAPREVRVNLTNDRRELLLNMPGVTDGKLAEKLAAREMAALTAASKSTRTDAMPHGGHTTENIQMPTEQDKQIADLTAKLAKAERLATLTDAQRAHYSKLGSDGEAYLAKSFAEREAVIAEIEKSNEVVYTSKATGESFRKSDDPRLVAMAKRQDAQAEELAKRDEAIEKAEVAKIAKEALEGVAGDDETHAYIVKSIRKGGGDAAMIEKAMATLRSSKEFTKQAAIAKGINPATEPQADGPQGEFDALVAKHAAEQKVDTSTARLAVVRTEKGRDLYNQIELQKKQRAHA